MQLDTQTERRQTLSTPPAWIADLEPAQRELIQLALSLWERETQLHSQLVDYGFIIFPMAKAYEGFLKKYFFDVGLITVALYHSRRFRIGKALNPDINPEFRGGEWVYGELERACGGETARLLWETWLNYRNQIFHYFPDKVNYVSLEQAEVALAQIITTISAAFACRQHNQTT